MKPTYEELQQVIKNVRNRPRGMGENLVAQEEVWWDAIAPVVLARLKQEISDIYVVTPDGVAAEQNGEWLYALDKLFATLESKT